MTNKHLRILLLAALTVLALSACGNTTETSSAPEGIDTFGVNVNPSAQPSEAQSLPGGDLPAEASAQPAPGTSSGPVIEGDTPESQSAAPSPSAVVSPAASQRPGGGSNTASPSARPSASVSTSDKPVSSPAISPPEPISTAKVEDAYDYVGKPLSTLVAELGAPKSADYEDVDEGNPNTDRIGTLQFNGFTVTTRRTADEEIVTAVTPD